MTAETTTMTTALTPAEIRTLISDFLISLGYTCPDEFSSGVANPRVERRESNPNEVTYWLFTLPSSQRGISATVITNCLNDVVVVNLRTCSTDAVYSQYFEVNTAYDREAAQQALIKASY